MLTAKQPQVALVLVAVLLAHGRTRPSLSPGSFDESKDNFLHTTVRVIGSRGANHNPCKGRRVAKDTVTTAAFKLQSIPLVEQSCKSHTAVQLSFFPMIRYDR
jgi:hypothetical protein